MKRLRPDESCWCDSGELYGKCHAAFDKKLDLFRKKHAKVPGRNLIKTREQVELIKKSAEVNVAVLDYVAALKFLVTGAWGDFKAVIRARREYKRMRGEYRSVREQNLAAAVVSSIKERSTFSLLWQYYFKQKKFFSQLK